MCECVHVFRIVSMDKILHFTNILVIIIESEYLVVGM